MLRFVTTVIEEVIDHPTDIDLNTPINNVCDSLDIIEVSMYIEDSLGIIIPDQIIMSWKTVGDIVDYVSNRTRKTA